MTDLVTVGIGIDTSKLVRANAEVQVLGRELTKAERDAIRLAKAVKTVEREISLLEAATVKAAKAEAKAAADAARERNAWFADQRRILDMKEQSAKIEAKITAELVRQRDAQAKLNAQKADQYQADINSTFGIGVSATDNGAGFSAFGGELDRLQAKFDRMFLAQQLYQKELDDINAAHLNGIISTKAMENAVEDLTLQYQAFQNQTAGVNNIFMRQAQGMGIAANRSNELGVVTQQLGYQVGDFLVQVQSGTNWMVAFGQQATQLVGVLPLMGAGFMGLSTGALVALSAGLGIIIPLITAVGAAWMRTKAEQDKAGSSMNSLEQQVKSLDSTLSQFELNRKARNLGITADELISKDAFDQAKQNLQDYIAFQDTLLFQARKSILDTLSNYTIFFDLEEVFGLDAASNIKALQDQIGDAKDRQLQVQQQMLNNYNTERQALMDRMQMEQTIARYGEDSHQVKLLQEQADRKTYQSELQRLGLNDELVNRLMDVYDEQTKITDAIEDQNRVAKIVFNTSKDILDAVTSISKQDISNVFSKALGPAQQLLNYTKQILNAEAGAVGSGPAGVPKVPSGLGAELPKLFGSVPPALGGLAPSTSLRPQGAPSGVGGIDWGYMDDKSGGGGGASDNTEQLLNQYKSLLATFDPLIAAQNEYDEDLKMLNEALAAGVINADQFKNALGLINERLAEAKDPLNDFKQSLEDALDPNKNYIKGLQALQSSLSEFLFNPFEVGLDGMILGFSRALQRMASDALAAQFMQMFIGGMGGGAGGWFASMFANGGAFSGGREIKAFASGGVVGSPTFFPMSGGKTGLMGEAGPEAIMPLKRGSNGKLGVQVEGNGGAKSTKIINVLDPRIVGEYLNTSDGEEVIMNVMRRTGVI